MPLEELNCKNCGSNDLNEVKTGTYFCNNCETVFKHFDASKITVNPAFCECGNVVRFRCGSCGGGLCQWCDALFINYPGTETLWPQWNRKLLRVVSETYGYAYLDDSVLTLPTFKLLPFIHYSGDHLCRRCLYAAVPAVVEGLRSGHLCRNFECPLQADYRCRCCSVALCQKHLAPGDRTWNPLWEYGNVFEEAFAIGDTAPRFQAAFTLTETDFLSITWTWYQMCGGCRGEVVDTLAELILHCRVAHALSETLRIVRSALTRSDPGSSLMLPSHYDPKIFKLLVNNVDYYRSLTDGVSWLSLDKRRAIARRQTKLEDLERTTTQDLRQRVADLQRLSDGVPKDAPCQLDLARVGGGGYVLVDNHNERALEP